MVSKFIAISNLTEYLSLWYSSSLMETSTIEDCSEILKEVEVDCVFIFTQYYHHPMSQAMKKSCGYLNNCLYLHKTYELISNPYTLDGGPSVAPTFSDGHVVIYEDNNNTVSTLDEDNNKNHVRKIYNENNKLPNKHRKLKKKTQLQITSCIFTTSEP